MRMNVSKKATKAQITKVVEHDSSKSAKMRALFELGLEVKEIAEIMGTRYNFAYNVISNYIMTTEGLDIITEKKASKKDAIIELHIAGKSNKEIAIELKTNYNYVFSTIKQHKAKQAEAEAK